jgi:hypothetical protein
MRRAGCGWSFPAYFNMRKRLSFLVAAMAVAAAAPANADPGKMFVINAVTPGVVSFSGEGTAQFNNSSSTANNFSVGSNTGFGVNGSASSTNDYLVDSFANLALTSNSQLQQSLGTSAQAANVATAADSASASASKTATEATTAKYGNSFSDYNDTVGQGVAGFTDELFTTEAAWEQASSNYSDTVKDTTLNELINSASSSSSSSSNQDQSASGVISGSFYTENNSNSSISADAGTIREFAESASASADSAMGVSISDYQNKFAAIAVLGGTAGGLSNALIDTDAERAEAAAVGLLFAESGAALEGDAWKEAKTSVAADSFESLSTAAASTGVAHMDSTADVSVTGVGSIATLNAADTSVFTTNIETRQRAILPDNNGTANGSAGGNLSTASFANQSNTQSASAFMQAFGADTVEITGNATDGYSANINARFDSAIDNFDPGIINDLDFVADPDV